MLHPRRMIYVLTLFIVFLTTSYSFAQSDKFEANLTRLRLLGMVERTPLQDLHVIGHPKSEKARQFLQYFMNHIFVPMQTLHVHQSRLTAQSLLLNLGFAKDDQEAEKWVDRTQRFVADVYHLQNDQNLTAVLEEWARLSRGLEGELPRIARQLAADRRLKTFNSDQQAIANEIAILIQEYAQGIAQTPAMKKMGEYNRLMNKSSQLFHKGKIDFRELQRRDAEVRSKMGPAWVGFQAIKRNGDLVNRLAILRSQLAIAKESSSWMAFETAVAGEAYSKTLGSVNLQKNFLRKLLSKILVPYQKILKMRFRAMGLARFKYRTQFAHDILLLPEDPKDIVAQPFTELWQEKMLEAGFTNDFLNQVIVHAEGAPKTAARTYLGEVRIPLPASELVDAETLSTIPMPFRDHRPGLMVLTLTGSPNRNADLRRLFHEGGRAVDLLTRNKPGEVGVAPATSEIMPLLFENFVHQADQAQALKDLKTFVQEVRTSLFDLEMWDYDYSKEGAQTFVDRAFEVAKEVGLFDGDGPEVRTPIPLSYTLFSSTSHFGGNPQALGAVFAKIAALQLKDYVSDTLEKSSGRRDWNHQNELAQILSQSISTELWKKPFPQNIEAITGRSFTLQRIVDEAEQLAHSISPCALDLEGT